MGGCWNPVLRFRVAFSGKVTGSHARPLATIPGHRGRRRRVFGRAGAGVNGPELRISGKFAGQGRQAGAPSGQRRQGALRATSARDGWRRAQSWHGCHRSADSPRARGIAGGLPTRQEGRRAPVNAGRVWAQGSYTGRPSFSSGQLGATALYVHGTGLPFAAVRDPPGHWPR